MVQGLGMLRLPRLDVVWWTCLVSTILLVLGIGCGAVLAQDRQPRNDGKNLPEGCGHLIADIDEKDLQWPPFDDSPHGSLQTQKPHFINTDGSFGSLRLGTLRRLGLIPGVITETSVGQYGQFRASESGRQSVSFYLTGPPSRTAYNDVHFVEVQLDFVMETSQGGFVIKTPGIQLQRYFFLKMSATIQGVFSDRTGRFCATLCMRDLTPAQLAYRVEHPDSTSVPDTLVSRDCEIHIELEFPKAATIATPLITGVMASLRSQDDPSYFHPLAFYWFSSARYVFNTSVYDEAQILGANAMPDISSGVHKDMKVWSHDPPFCATKQNARIFIHSNIYPPIWNSSCGSDGGGGLCSPFQTINISRIVDSSVEIDNIHCSVDWRISAVFVFKFTQQSALAESSTKESSSEFLLVAEGYWNSSKSGQLVMVAHYVTSDGTPLDSKILITLQIPMARTINHRYSLIGHVRSTREASDPLYFASFSLVGDIRDSVMQLQQHGVYEGQDTTFLTQPHFSYNYDDSIKIKIQPVCSLAASSYKSHKNARFPDGSIARDFAAHLAFKFPWLVNSSERDVYVHNLAIDQKFSQKLWGRKYHEEQTVRSRRYSTPHSGEIPVSFRFVSGPVPPVEAEGFYDSTTGHLCLLGCRRKWEDVAEPYEEDDNGEVTSQSESCDLVFSIQYPPTNPRLWEKNPLIIGTLKSLRAAGHPLYFEPLTFNSSLPALYAAQTQWSFLRRNAETIMSLATLSLATFFVAIQVGYSSRESSSRNVRFVSLVMLIVLTSGHFFPLLLSFDFIWTKSIHQVTFQFSRFTGWPEAHEVIVRGTSMVALLLEVRLLQLVWRSRSRANNSTPRMGTAGSTPPKVSDVSVLRACLPIYAAMLVVVGFVHWQQGPHQKQRTILAWVWSDLQAFSGVILDLFLFPQVFANVLWDTEEKVAPLYPLFYLGVTAVRSAPHLFDALRSSVLMPELHSLDYYYANPNWDLYSMAWDKVIPCCSVALAAVLLLQQRYGGRCFIPKRLRRRSNYQLVGVQYQDL